MAVRGVSWCSSTVWVLKAGWAGPTGVGCPTQDGMQGRLARSAQLPLPFPAQVFRIRLIPFIINFLFLKALLLLTPQRSLQHNERTFLMTQRFLN